MRNRWRQVVGVVGIVIAVAGLNRSEAMESNLNLPFDSKMSPPATPELAFYSRQVEDLLFDPATVQDGQIEIRCQAGRRCVGLKYEVSRNKFETAFIKGDATALPANTFIIKIPTEKLLYPGFYDIKVSLDHGMKEPLSGLCAFGWRVKGGPDGGGLKVRETRPADFAAFWAKGKAALAQVPLQPEQGELKKYQGKEIDAYNVASAALPGDYDPTGHKTDVVEAGKVSFASIKGLRVHGWLAKPLGDGPFPAMLVLPGGGIVSRPMPLEHARHGYLALDIQVHGHDVDLKEYPKAPGYYNDGHEVFSPPEDNYWNKVYLNCWQAVNYLAARKDVDPKRIVVVGGSQGGRMSVVLAGLEPRIAAAVPAIAHFGNIVYWRWAEILNKAKQTGMDLEIPPVPADTPEERCWVYYDVMNFAPDVQCPVFMNIGLVDPVSMPTGVWAIYQRLGSKHKKMAVLPGMGHDWSAEFDRQAWRWLDEKLGQAGAGAK